MPIYSKTIDQSIVTQRIISQIDGRQPGPCLIFFAGIHGNEPSGIFALKQVFQEINSLSTSINGKVYAIAGNLPALELRQRFCAVDLNRIWTPGHIKALESGSFQPKNEDEKQQLSIYMEINQILEKERGPFYFFDLHTTSSSTNPFIVVNDSLLNRKFTNLYPLPSILGIEEYLEGPLLSYINELGYVSFGFEAGQHDAPESIENHKIFIILSLVFAGVIGKDCILFDDYYEKWKALNPNIQDFYEIYERYAVGQSENFVMKPGFANFQKITKGDELAESNGTTIKAEKNAIIFMPLYQAKGHDGYFLIKPIPHFFLWLSRLLRRNKIDRIFPYLPGIRWNTKEKETMIVDLRIAQFIARPLFHLFGYRNKKIDSRYLLIRNREYRSKESDYVQEYWYKT